ncbi:MULTISPECIES: hypothetical protein [unclassified Nitrospina]|uniref:hypothetical protein n=1 Tax=unclassified Nitrospina TaxID=2638683 RepID=UPI003F9C94B4
MFLEVEPCGNVDQPFSMMYREMESPREVYAIKYTVQGSDQPVQVTGWDAETNAPCPAYACRVEESGDGVALLIYGGTGGLRLKGLDDESAWDLHSAHQWGETHLVYPKDAFIVYKDEL